MSDGPGPVACGGILGLRENSAVCSRIYDITRYACCWCCQFLLHQVVTRVTAENRCPISETIVQWLGPIAVTNGSFLGAAGSIAILFGRFSVIKVIEIDPDPLLSDFL